MWNLIMGPAKVIYFLYIMRHNFNKPVSKKDVWNILNYTHGLLLIGSTIVYFGV